MSEFEVRFYREYFLDRNTPEDALDDARKMFKESMKAESEKFNYEIMFQLEGGTDAKPMKRSYVSGATRIGRDVF